MELELSWAGKDFNNRRVKAKLDDLDNITDEIYRLRERLDDVKKEWEATRLDFPRVRRQQNEN